MSESGNYAKHTPSTDALDTLGLIHWKEEKRDAIHLAVEAVVASEKLLVGARIGIIKGIAYRSGTKLEDGTEVPYHGIVDPFLTKGPSEGEQFWFVMRPREVKSLRHVWEHPDFPAGV